MSTCIKIISLTRLNCLAPPSLHKVFLESLFVRERGNNLFPRCTLIGDTWKQQRWLVGCRGDVAVDASLPVRLCTFHQVKNLVFKLVLKVKISSRRWRMKTHWETSHVPKRCCFYHYRDGFAPHTWIKWGSEGDRLARGWASSILTGAPRNNKCFFRGFAIVACGRAKACATLLFRKTRHTNAGKNFVPLVGYWEELPSLAPCGSWKKDRKSQSFQHLYESFQIF